MSYHPNRTSYNSNHHINGDHFDDDDSWLPFDYTSDIEDLPPDDDDDQPPTDAELNAYGTTTNVTNNKRPVDKLVERQIDVMPIIDETPVVVVKQKKVKHDKEMEESIKQQIKEDIEIQAALDRYDRARTAPTIKAAAKKAAPISKAKKSKSYPVGSEEVDKHQSLLMQIDRYRISLRFQDCLRASGLRLTGIEDLSIEELEDLTTRIRTVVGNRNVNGGGLMATMILGGTAVVENLPMTNAFVDIHGLSNLLANNDEFADITEQLSIDYSFASVMRPEMRLAMLMIKSGIQMNSINQYKANMMAQSPQNQPPIVTPVDDSAPITPNNPIIPPVEDGVRHYNVAPIAPIDNK